ncbi:MAG: hypothetical protein RLZZ519_3316 [Bacteroidota bacterium]
MTVMILWACAGESPKQVAEKFLTAVSVGDFEAAKKWATKESHTALDMAAANDEDHIYEPHKIQIGEETISENKATVVYKDNDDEKVLKLSKEDGKWKAAFSKSDLDGGAAANAEKFLNAFAHGDVDGAKKYATRDAQASLDMMAGTLEAKKANPDKIEMGDIKYSGDRATVSYHENGVLKTLDMVKEDGKWKAAWTKTSTTQLDMEKLGEDVEKAMDADSEE